MLKKVNAIPRGKVATYGSVAEAAGHPGCSRQVVWALRSAKAVPWHRVVGARGMIRLPGDAGLEQQLRLRAEGAVFVGNRVDLAQSEHVFRKRRKALDH
jgi:methylated-DNA-protein-cysteine methyltransferase-like protein